MTKKDYPYPLYAPWTAVEAGRKNFRLHMNGCINLMDQEKVDSEIAWQLHTAGKMLGRDYKITKKSVTTKTTTHEEIVIEYNHRLKSE